jgi:tetratricopeptide (TPR) repeat protein
MKNVKVQQDITFLSDEKGVLKIDIYFPPGLNTNELRPAIIFLNAIGERPGERKVKSWDIYTSWATLMAANGYIGISMEADAARIQKSIQSIFDFIEANGEHYNIDKNRLGVYAASANVTQSVAYLMNDKAYKGIKAAALFYGASPSGPFRKDLPVLFIISEGDVRPGSYDSLWPQVLKNNAPWTIKMGTAMPHAFDAYADNDSARRIIEEAISFWKNHLDPVPQPSFAHSKGRDVLGLLQMNRPKALLLLEGIIKETPSDVRALKLYASVLQHDNKLTAAEEAFKKALAIDPGDADVMISLAGLAYSQQKPAEAEKYITDVVNSGKINRDMYAQLGFNLLVAGKDKEAAVYYEKALAIEARGVDFYNLACAYAKVNDADEALKALDASLKYGYGSKQQIESDPDFNLIRTNKNYKAFIENMNH